MNGHHVPKALSSVSPDSQNQHDPSVTEPVLEDGFSSWASEGPSGPSQPILDPYTISFFTPPHEQALENFLDSAPVSEQDCRRRQRLVQNAWKQRGLEGLAETPEPFQYMLNNHWCWIQPLFNFIYRPAFTRDMHDLGPYYSHALLNAVLSHSSRWCRSDPQIKSLLEPYDNGALFARHARALLFEEISQGRCRIPTVQTLLMLSAHECGAGNRTSAWLYSGMAFRLIEDLGICVDNQRYAVDPTLSDEDIEIRNRLFWSCYFWDKMISLYLGRTPVLQKSEISPPQVMRKFEHCPSTSSLKV